MSTRKKRVSKKTKTSWRKNTDVADVTEFLEAKRTKEIRGVKKNEEVFTIDTEARKIKDIDLFLSRKERARSKPLKCFTAMINESAVSDPVIKRNTVTKPGEGKGISNIRKKQMSLKRLKKEAQSLNDSKKYSAKKASANIKTDAAQDVWDENYGKVTLPIDEQWLNPKTLVHTIEHFEKKIGKKSTFSRKKNSVLPAVEAPHPGESYNPTLEDHQDLLQQVADHEMKLIKLEKHIERVTTKMFCKKKDMPTEESKMKEMAEGLPIPGEEVVDEDLSDSEYKALNPPVLNKKKTLKKRKNLKKVKEEQMQRFNAKMEKKKVADIYRLKKLDEEMAAEKVVMDQNKEQKIKILKEKELQPKKMSNFNFVAPELDFNLPKDIRGTVRQVKTEGNILADRFKSMQKRNVIETRVKQKKIRPKMKPKRFVKASHKINVK
ncbi:Hypothetical predicted protein [Cloeon dipterum]|uniref:Ribosome biogenesis protein NOP53 n=1 Tax=Cloeon dipterum TaxID=197152 RepID=A0A8S1CGL1_9INSE|nr:Hypothetical predicted protein [Cloeon dipterum]